MSAKRHREDFPSKMTEEIAKSFGHETLRLPPYHCGLNSIELVWGTLKSYATAENADLKVETVEKLFRDRRDQLPKEFWENCVKHVKKDKRGLFDGDPIADVQVNEMIFEIEWF